MANVAYQSVQNIINKASTLSLKGEKPNTIEVEVKHPIGVTAGAENSADKLPETSRKRLEKYGIDLSKGYPTRPEYIPVYLDEVAKINDLKVEGYIERGKGADPEKKALFAKVKEVKHLTKYVGTELVGVQLEDLKGQELDELALLIAERIVVVFRNQDLSPQKHLELGYYFSPLVEKHPLTAQALPGITVVWDKFNRGGPLINFKRGSSGSYWHQDLDHLDPGISHLHLDAIPETGGDTGFISAYAAYDKLSPAFREFLDDKVAVHISAHPYLDRDDPLAGPKHYEREHPLVFTHPATGWKALFYNPAHTVRIKGLEPEESKTILDYLNDVYTRNLDIQARISWQPTEKGLGTSVIWDNRIAQHVAIPDYNDAWEGPVRHGHRVVSLSEPVALDPHSKSQREALGLK